MKSRDFRPVEQLLSSTNYSSKVKEFLFAYWMQVRNREIMANGRFIGLHVGNGEAAKHFLKDVNMVIQSTIQVNEDDCSKTYIVRIHETHGLGKGLICVLNEQDIVGMKYTVDKIID